MNKSIVLAAAAVFLAGLGFAADARDDQKALEGNWEAVAVTRDGKEAPPDQVKKHLLKIKGAKFRYEMFRTILTGTMTLNPAATPKGIRTSRNAARGTGIYELKGDALRLCMPTRAATRPSEFTGQAGFQLTEFKKVK